MQQGASSYINSNIIKYQQLLRRSIVFIKKDHIIYQRATRCLRRTNPRGSTGKQQCPKCQEAFSRNEHLTTHMKRALPSTAPPTHPANHNGRHPQRKPSMNIWTNQPGKKVHKQFGTLLTNQRKENMNKKRSFQSKTPLYRIEWRKL